MKIKTRRLDRLEEWLDCILEFFNTRRGLPDTTYYFKRRKRKCPKK